MKDRVRKPEWLKISIGANERYTETKRIVDSHCLHTICSSGRCPNMGECWGKGTATFMIGGDICTRCCKFCNTQTGRPLPLDPNEPTHVAESVALMKLSHAVITSVDRDDLPDLGAAHWARTIREIKRLNPETTVEVLIPDFQGRKELVAQVIEARPEIISHNMETVKRISPLVRSAARYETSLEVIRQIAASGTTAKSGIMVGLGETPEEVEELMDDLHQADCQILTIGNTCNPRISIILWQNTLLLHNSFRIKRKDLLKVSTRWRVHRWCVLLIMPRNKFGSIKKKQNKNQLLYLFVMYEVTAK